MPDAVAHLMQHGEHYLLLVHERTRGVCWSEAKKNLLPAVDIFRSWSKLARQQATDVIHLLRPERAAHVSIERPRRSKVASIPRRLLESGKNSESTGRTQLCLRMMGLTSDAMRCSIDSARSASGRSLRCVKDLTNDCAMRR